MPDPDDKLTLHDRLLATLRKAFLRASADEGPELRAMIRMVESRQIGDLTRSRAAEQTAFEAGARAARKADLAAVEGERLEDPQPGTGDDGYEMAIGDAGNAIRALPMPERT